MNAAHSPTTEEQRVTVADELRAAAERLAEGHPMFPGDAGPILARLLTELGDRAEDEAAVERIFGGLLIVGPDGTQSHNQLPELTEALALARLINGSAT